MSRIQTPILTDTSYAKGKAPMINLENLGQFGPMIDERSFYLDSPVPQEHGICRIVDYPKGFDLMPDGGKKMRGALKALVEKVAVSWEGIPVKKNVETEDVPFGGDGQSRKVATDVKIEEVNVTFDFGKEVAGMSKHYFFDTWIELFIGNTQSKVPLIIENDDVAQFQKTLDFYSFSAVFFIPDPWMRNVYKAALVRDLFPRTNGDEEIKRAINTPKELKDVNIEFGGHAVFDSSAIELAQLELDRMNPSGFNPNNRQAVVTKVNESLDAHQNGFTEMVNAVAGAVEE